MGSTNFKERNDSIRGTSELALLPALSTWQLLKVLVTLMNKHVRIFASNFLLTVLISTFLDLDNPLSHFLTIEPRERIKESNHISSIQGAQLSNHSNVKEHNLLILKEKLLLYNTSFVASSYYIEFNDLI